MFRNKQDYKKFGLKTLNCLIADNGVGDMLAAFPAINYAAGFPYINLLVWVPDHMVELAKNTLNPRAIVRGYSEADDKYEMRAGITTRWDKRVSPMRMHPVDYAFVVLTDSLPTDMSLKNYPKANVKKINIKKFKLPKKYVVIQATATEKVKSMPVATANALSKYVVSKGYTPVYLGKTLTQSGVDVGDIKAHDLLIDKSLGLDLVDKASLVESIAILDKAKCFIGMDGGLMHMAAFTYVAIVSGYTFINPEHNLPIRNNEIGWNCFPVVPDKSLGCAFCQTNMNFAYGYDYRECFPYTEQEGKHLCVKQMTADKFINILDNLL